ncbi:hypothetical protein [Salmonella enterica]|uniref:hypothetical protein n=1 Tax=Salmonella enterica TaxID=28901 RepID=UPI001CA47AB0|nr:hypothetical protein [Salmonella enterica]
MWPSLESVERAVGVLYRHVRIDTDGPKDLQVHVERQDLDEMLGNLIENVAKYGGGSVFVTVSKHSGFVEFDVKHPKFTSEILDVSSQTSNSAYIRLFITLPAK